MSHTVRFTSYRNATNLRASRAPITSRTFRAMDLLSLAFRTLELADSSEKQEEPRVHGQESADRCPRRSGDRSAVKDKRKTRREGEKEGGFPAEDDTVLLDVIALSEVAWHDTPDDCWIVLYDYVYDCTDFLNSHPGGEDVLLEYAGRDATLAFVGFGHPPAARETLQRYLVGELPPEERIFRVPGGLKVVGF